VKKVNLFGKLVVFAVLAISAFNVQKSYAFPEFCFGCREYGRPYTTSTKDPKQAVESLQQSLNLALGKKWDNAATKSAIILNGAIDAETGLFLENWVLAKIAELTDEQRYVDMKTLSSMVRNSITISLHDTPHNEASYGSVKFKEILPRFEAMQKQVSRHLDVIVDKMIKNLDSWLNKGKLQVIRNMTDIVEQYAKKHDEDVEKDSFLHYIKHEGAIVWEDDLLCSLSSAIDKSIMMDPKLKYLDEHSIDPTIIKENEKKAMLQSKFYFYENPFYQSSPTSAKLHVQTVGFSIELLRLFLDKDKEFFNFVVGLNDEMTNIRSLTRSEIQLKDGAEKKEDGSNKLPAAVGGDHIRTSRSSIMNYMSWRYKSCSVSHRYPSVREKNTAIHNQPNNYLLR